MSNILQKLLKASSNSNNEEKSKLIYILFNKISEYKPELKNLHQEILYEIASSLKNAEEKLRESIQECVQIENLYKKSCDESEKNQLKFLFIHKQKEAHHQKWKFIVQRESLGLKWTEELDQTYRIPNLFF